MVLDMVFAAWRQAAGDAVIERIEVTQRPDYSFDLGFLEGRSPTETTAFAAFDNRFLNFKRLELMGLIRERGFRMDRFVSPSASVAPDVKIGENSFISDGVVVGPGACIQYSSFIGARVIVGPGADVGPVTWIAPGVVIGSNVRIGAHTTLGMGVQLADGVQVGRLCVVEVPGLYRSNIGARTFFNTNFDEPIRTFN